MKENLKTPVLVFSIILNMVFIGSFAYSMLSSRFSVGQSSGSHPFLCQELNVGGEQKDTIAPIRDRFHARLSRIGDAIKQKQLTLVDLLAASNLDRKAIDGLQGEIQALQQDMQDTIISHILDETKLCSPEHKERFFKLMKERIEQTSQPYPSWMKSSEGR